MNRKRVGRFQVYFHMLEKESMLVRAVLNDCLIVKAESLFHAHCVEYVAFCASFREIADGEDPLPFYEPLIDVKPYGPVLTGWKEMATGEVTAKTEELAEV